MDLLNGVDFEINRLTEQAKCWEPEAEILFDRIPFNRGGNVLIWGAAPWVFSAL